MHSVVQKWGHSLALRIPKSFAQEINLDCGTEVDLSLRENNLVVSRKHSRTYSLAGLLKGITKKNVHEEVSTGKTVGRERV
jgi:antitoxin MazE